MGNSCQTIEEVNGALDSLEAKGSGTEENAESPIQDLKDENGEDSTSIHTNCRYPNEYRYRRGSHSIKRTKVTDDKVSWNVRFDQYKPVEFTAPHVFSAVWADPKLEDEDFIPAFNELDGNVNRKSHEGVYLVSNMNEPLNIRGRTGMKGRGTLGRWGPNHAADPIVTRWKRDAKGEIVADEKSGKNILQFVSIKRKDCGEWAIPGGMVDPGELVCSAVKREFLEEAMNFNEITSDQEQTHAKEMVDNFFDSCGIEVYSGYVDDPRNTDNAWMETTAFWFHDDTGEKVGKFKLQAGDDAGNLRWMDLRQDSNLYASHSEYPLLKKVIETSGAHY